MMGMLIYLISFFTAIIGPLIIWLIKKDDSEFVNFHGKEYFNFFISYTVYIFVGSLLMIILIVLIIVHILEVMYLIFTLISLYIVYIFVVSLLMIILIGLIIVPILAVMYLIFTLIALYKAYKGEHYRIPLIFRIIK